MTNQLNEEIRAIRHTISHLKQGMVLEPNQSKKEQMKRDVEELNSILVDKLNQCGDYR